MDKQKKIMEQLFIELREVRKELKMSQQKVGDLFGVSRVYISQIEQNTYPSISTYTLLKLCELYKVNLYELLEKAENHVNKREQNIRDK